jgi:4-hydroxy-3-methylbut-2-en-1-yl diphosphate reductase
VGGYNSSNTSHIVDLCEQKLPTYFVSSSREIISRTVIQHYDYHKKEVRITKDFLPGKTPVDIILTSGASCPDTLVDAVLDKLLGFFEGSRQKEEVLEELLALS